MCKEQSPARPQEETHPEMRHLIEVITSMKDDRISTVCANLSAMKSVEVSSPEKTKTTRVREENPSEFLEDEQNVGAALASKKKGTPLQPPAKRRRVAEGKAKKCCVKGCKKSTFGQKNGLFAQIGTRTSVPLILTEFIIMHVTLSLFIVDASNALQLGKMKKT